MSLVPCMVRSCPHYVREGLRRGYGAKGVDGQQLADGETCWRCRAKQARQEKAAAKKHEEAMRKRREASS